jgi:hypothetical protein
MTGPALSGAHLEVEGSVHLEGLTVTGCGEDGAVRLLGARIGEALQFGTKLHSLNGPVLDLRSVSVRDLTLPIEAVICPAQECSRRPDSPEPLLLDGLTYTAIPKPHKNGEGQWLKLLGECALYAGQPYQQLASVYRAFGEEDKARKILIAQQNDLHKRGELLGGRWGRALHWLLGKTIGYGYRTWSAFLGLALVVVLAMVLGLFAGWMHGDDRWLAAHTDKAAPARVGSSCSIAERAGLGIERALPLFIGNTGLRERCALDSHSSPGQIATVIGWALQLAAWAFATLAIVGFTGLIRKT